MRYKLMVLAAYLSVALFLAGCNESGGNNLGSLLGSGGSPGASGSGAAILSGGSDSGLGAGSNSLGSGSSGGINLAYNPEPATMALLGSGLFAYAFFKRKKKK